MGADLPEKSPFDPAKNPRITRGATLGPKHHKRLHLGGLIAIAIVIDEVSQPIFDPFGAVLQDIEKDLIVQWSCRLCKIQQYQRIVLNIE